LLRFCMILWTSQLASICEKNGLLLQPLDLDSPSMMDDVGIS